MAVGFTALLDDVLEGERPLRREPVRAADSACHLLR